MSLRPLTEEDLSLVLLWRNSPEVRMSMFRSTEISVEEHIAWFERTRYDPSSFYFLHFTNEIEADGLVYFTQYDRVARTAFWGFYKAPGAIPGTGRRMGVEALDYSFFELKLHKLSGEALANNGASLRFHKKLGFTQEGLFRDGHYNGATYVDVVRFAILDAEWSRQRVRI